MAFGKSSDKSIRSVRLDREGSADTDVLITLPTDGNDAYSAVAFVLAIIFLAIANVLLLNVLVALFK